jgi:hypothetical protein
MLAEAEARRVLGDAALDTGVPGAIEVEGDPWERGLAWVRPMSDLSIRRQWVMSPCPHSLGMNRLEADERGRRSPVCQADVRHLQ